MALLISLYEFLPVAGVVQSDDDKEGRGDQHVYPAMENGVEEYLRVLVNGNIIRVEEDVPHQGWCPSCKG